jgi:undecaprenyl-diphosphatase
LTGCVRQATYRRPASPATPKLAAKEPMFHSDLFLAVLVGIVEGLTEFLPVSSTGHMLLADEILGFKGPPGRVFEIVIQPGAILAVIWVYRQRLFDAVRGLATEPRQQRFVATVAIAFLPAAIVGLAIHQYIKEMLRYPAIVAVAFIVGGIAILAVERWRPKPRIHEIEEMKLRTAFGIGCFQILAMIPGMSRAGMTIIGALALGVDRKPATEFSFFLAIPTIIGAAVLDLWKSRADLSGGDVQLIVIGFVTSFLIALIVVRTLVGFVSRHGFAPFAWYRIAAGVTALVLLLR